MTDQRRHPADELQLLLDERLPPEGQRDVEAHLAGCERCRRELDLLRRVRAAVREGLPSREVPPALLERVTAALAAETAVSGASRPPAAKAVRSLRRRVLVGLALAAGLILAVVLARPGRQDPVAAAAEDFAGYRAGRLALELETNDPAELERFFTSAGLPFTTRVFDFGMMGYRLTGGRVHRFAGRPSALFAYQSDNGRRLICEMYEGRLSDLPSGAAERDHDGIRFRIYRDGGVTLVFWQEADVVCVLIADGDPEEAIQLAYAKARSA
ncbi:MAG TPA: zf-HC2 domain-containing protein [Gemmatimonadales bacterium]